MTAPKLVSAARRRGKASDANASKEVLLETLLVLAGIAGDPEAAPSARQRAAGTIATITERLDAIDREVRTSPGAVEGVWGDRSTFRAV